MNEVEVVVRAKDETTKIFDDVVKKSKKAGSDAGDGLSKTFGDRIMQVVSKVANLGEKIAGKAVEGFAKFGAGLPGVLGEAVGKLPPQGQAIAGVLAAGLAVSLAPILAAAISSAVLLAVGGGVLVAGIAAAMQNPKIAKAFEPLKETAQSIFKDFGKPFEGPLLRAAKTLDAVLKDLRKPIQELGKIIAPVIDKLTPALGEFAQKLLPGIRDAVKSSVPLFEILAEKLPAIGVAISEFFSSISENGEDTNQFFSDLLDFITGLIVALGDLIAWVTSFYNEWRSAILALIGIFRIFAAAVLNVLGIIVNGAAKAFGWIPGLGGMLRGAAKNFNNFRDEANRALAGIDESVTVTVRFRIVGQAAANAAVRTGRLLAGMGYAHGGLVGQAATAATGGPRSNQVWVGEQGPELVDLAPGSRVHSNADSMRMASEGSGSSQPIHVTVQLDGRVVAEQLVPHQRRLVSSQGRGSVQKLYGQPGVA
jgi:hypothetical protein